MSRQRLQGAGSWVSIILQGPAETTHRGLFSTQSPNSHRRETGHPKDSWNHVSNCNVHRKHLGVLLTRVEPGWARDPLPMEFRTGNSPPAWRAGAPLSAWSGTLGGEAPAAKRHALLFTAASPPAASLLLHLLQVRPPLRTPNTSAFHKVLVGRTVGWVIPLTMAHSPCAHSAALLWLPPRHVDASHLESRRSSQGYGHSSAWPLWLASQGSRAQGETMGTGSYTG